MLLSIMHVYVNAYVAPVWTDQRIPLGNKLDVALPSGNSFTILRGGIDRTRNRVQSADEMY